MRTYFEEHCVLHCTDNDKTVDAEVLNHQPFRSLTVTINREIKVPMRYVEQHNIYVGSMAGREFTTPGPKEINVKEGR
jgi:hypothetical protein